MSEILLQTKLYIPAARHNLVPRLRLLARLNEGLNGRLTLVSAPAGFGKTTLIAHWGQQLAQAGDWQFAWLALDENDNDVGRFFTYFIAALQRVDGRLAQTALEKLQTAQTSNIQPILTHLVNDLAQTAPAIVLVLDDYHLITNPAIHQGISFLIEHSPPHFHLLLISRADPPFSLARFRVRHQLTEIRQDDLRFSPGEADSFLNELMALDLPQTAVIILENRTEGWIAGLQMAALSLRGHPDADRFLADFTGSHRYIFDYLAEEVLARHPAGTRDFLLQTAVLDRFCAPLCDVLLETRDLIPPKIQSPATSPQSPSQQILEQLETANLFLIPLDDSRHWYRYHHLFADLLRQFLRREMPEREVVLHSRASRWYEEAGFIYEAIEHALKAKELTRAAALMEPIAFGMAYRMENDRLGRWIRALPDGLLMEYPNIVFPYAIILSATNQMEAYTSYLQKMEAAAQANIAKPAAQLILGQVGVLNCIRLHMQGEYEQALTAVTETEALLRQYNQPYERWELISIVGYATNHVVGDGATALDYLARATRLGVADEGSIGTTLCHTFTANALIQQGRLRRAATHLQTAAQAAVHKDQPQLHAVFPAALLARLHYEWNELDEAGAQVAKYLPLSVIAGFTMDPVDTVFVQVMLPLARGELDRAVSHMATATQYFQTLVISTGFARRLAAIQALLWLHTGELPQAVQWAETIQIPATEAGWRPMDAFVYLVWARVQLAQANYAAVIQPLVRLRQWAGGQLLGGIELETAVLQALVAHAQNDTTTAQTHLRTALALAEPEGYTRLFVDEGEAMVQLLQTAVKHNITPTYTTHLLQQFRSVQATDKPPHPLTPAPPALISSPSAPLSPRETEVLLLIAQGLTNKAIGAKLFIAPSTVKRHSINIYNKLGVNGRAEATARAYELGIIQSD